MPKRRNREVLVPPPVPSDGLYRLEQFYEQTVAPFVNHFGHRPLTDLDPMDSRPLRLDEATKQFVPVETWEQVLRRSGVIADVMPRGEAIRVYWGQLRRSSACTDGPLQNRVAVYLRRDGSWLSWLAHGIDERSGACIGGEQVLKANALRKVQLPDGYVPCSNPGGEQLADHVARTIGNVLRHALSTTITRHNGAVTSMRHVQYAQSV